jgi:hypothetical protein
MDQIEGGAVFLQKFQSIAMVESERIAGLGFDVNAGYNEPGVTIPLPGAALTTEQIKALKEHWEASAARR